MTFEEFENLHEASFARLDLHAEDMCLKAWNAAIDAAKDMTVNHRGWSDLDGRWIDPDDLERQLEKLKTT